MRVSSSAVEPVEETVSTLLASSGMLDGLARGGMAHGEEMVERACVSGQQQKVSRFHSRQLKFSNRLPSSSASEDLEKTVQQDNDQQVDRLGTGFVSLRFLTRPHAKEVLYRARVDGMHLVDIDA